MKEPAPAHIPRFVRRGELSMRLGVSLRTIDRWTSRGLIPSVSLTGMRMYDAVGLEDLLLSLARRALKKTPARHQQRTRKKKHV